MENFIMATKRKGYKVKMCLSIFLEAKVTNFVNKIFLLPVSLIKVVEARMLGHGYSYIVPSSHKFSILVDLINGKVIEI